MLFSLWRQFLAKQRSNNTRYHARKRPLGWRRVFPLALEPLEPRTLLSVTASINAQRVLNVIGDDSPNTITVRLKSGDTTKLEVVDGTAVNSTFNLSAFDTIFMDGRGGNDNLSVNEANGAMPASVQLTTL